MKTIMSRTIVKRATKRVWDPIRQCFIKPPPGEPAQGHTPTLGEAALDEINRLNKHIDKLIRNSAELEQERADLLAACKALVADASLTSEPFPSAVVRRSNLAKLQAAIAKAEGRAQ